MGRTHEFEGPPHKSAGRCALWCVLAGWWPTVQPPRTPSPKPRHVAAGWHRLLGYAQKKGKKINKDKHCVLAGPHPSPLSAHRGFFGCNHFSDANKYLKKRGG